MRLYPVGLAVLFLSGASACAADRPNVLFFAVDAYELYDHRVDPQENSNLANDVSNQALVAKLTTQLRAGWRAALPERSEAN